jgi:hypothetical protein
VAARAAVQDFGHFSQRLASLPLVMHVGWSPFHRSRSRCGAGLYIRGQVLRPDGAPFRVVNPHPCWITASTTGFETRDTCGRRRVRGRNARARD